MFGKLFGKKNELNKDTPIFIELKKPKAIKKFGGSKKVIAPYNSYVEVMKLVPNGKLITKELIRAYMAKKYEADFTDGVTSEIYINLVVNQSAEQKIDGVPHWRTLEMDGRLNDRFPGGVEGQKLMLENEGHTVTLEGKFYYVKDFEKKVYKGLMNGLR